MSYRRDRSLPAALLAMCIAGPACADCPVSGEETVRVSAVETRLELRLEDGRLIRLIGLDPASQTPSDPDRADAARATLAAQLAGHTITLHRVSATPDRWGRIAAMAFATGDTSARETGDIALTAIAKGLGRYHADARRPALPRWAPGRGRKSP